MGFETHRPHSARIQRETTEVVVISLITAAVHPSAVVVNAS